MRLGVAGCLLVVVSCGDVTNVTVVQVQPVPDAGSGGRVEGPARVTASGGGGSPAARDGGPSERVDSGAQEAPREAGADGGTDAAPDGAGGSGGAPGSGGATSTGGSPGTGGAPVDAGPRKCEFFPSYDWCGDPACPAYNTPECGGFCMKDCPVPPGYRGVCKPPNGVSGPQMWGCDLQKL